MDTRDRFGANDAPEPQGNNGANAHLDAELLGAYRDRAALRAGDGALDPAALAAAEAHLFACVECRDALRELDATVALLGALPQVAPRRSFILTPELVAASGGRVRPAPRPRFGWVWPTRWASAAVALLFALTIGLDLGDNGAITPASSSTTATLIAPTSTPVFGGIPITFETPAAPLSETQVGAFEFGTPVIFGEPTPAPAPAVAATPAQPTDWLAAEIFLGALAAVLAFFGFGLPPLLRRRRSSAA